MTVHLAIVNRRELGVQEWQYSLFLIYGVYPPDITRSCEGCKAKFSIYHYLDCKKGGLIMALHNELRERVLDLSGNVFIPTNMHDLRI